MKCMERGSPAETLAYLRQISQAAQITWIIECMQELAQEIELLKTPTQIIPNTQDNNKKWR